MGVTAHWIDVDLKRKSMALACQRFTSLHTYDRTAYRLESILAELRLVYDTVQVTITENGSNFVKAFKKFDWEIETYNLTTNESEGFEH